MSNESYPKTNSELPSRNERPSDLAEEGFREAGKTTRKQIGEYYATVRQVDQFDHVENMEEYDLEKRNLKRKERKSVRDDARKREKDILQMVKDNNFSEETASKLIQGSRNLEKKYIDEIQDSPSHEYVEAEWTNQPQNE